MKIVRFIVLIFIGVASGMMPAFAEDAERALSGDIQIGASHGNDPLVTIQLYLEYALPSTAGHSVWAVAYHDKEFAALYAGIARKFGDFQLGVGLGNARYDATAHPTINVWSYYANSESGVEASFAIERYGRDHGDPLFYKGYLQKRFGQFFGGVYGEKGLGIGPKLGFSLTDSVSLNMVIPVAKRPHSYERTDVVATLTFAF